MTRVTFFLLALCFSAIASGAFKITYPEDVDQIKRVKNSTLILNKATDFLVNVGSGTPDEVPGDADSVPMRDAMLLLTPKGWRAYASDVEFDDVKVDLVRGEPWTNALERAGQDHGMIFIVDWKRREIHIEPHTEIGEFDVSGVPFDEDSANVQGPKQLHLQAGDLRESLEFFAMLNGMKLEVDIFSDDRKLRVHPTVAEYTHPVPECVSWNLSNRYSAVTTEWLSELNRILKPYRLKIFLFSNNVIFLTSLHKYGNDFCMGESNENS